MAARLWPFRPGKLFYAEPAYYIGNALTFASRGETVQPGELMSSGTLHDGCSLEIGRWVAPGDSLELTIEGVGSVRNVIGDPR
jgi:2-keto-4-pentenoate hydratase/2-oxohepta-3-ene-1,7-dioic acid hydratase in catechol pathway